MYMYMYINSYTCVRLLLYRKSVYMYINSYTCIRLCRESMYMYINLYTCTRLCNCIGRVYTCTCTAVMLELYHLRLVYNMTLGPCTVNF